MLGRNPNFVTTQGQIVADLFAAAGCSVSSVSARVNKAARLADIAQFLIRNRRRIDVIVLEVYSGLSMVMSDAVSSLAALLKIPLIAVLHGGNLPDFVRRNRAWTRRVFRRARILIAPSPFLAEAMRRFDFDVRVVPNVIDLDAYPFKQRRSIAPNLIWMRSFHPTYNPALALETLALLRKTHPNATLTMAGVDKGLENAMKNAARAMNLDAAIKFPGFLDHSGKIREFERADVYLNTNRVDNMPVSVVEACALGLPVVATRVGGVPYLLAHEETGLLVPDDDAEAMRAAVARLLAEPDLTEKLSRGGRELAARSGWTAVRAEWEKLFAEVVDCATAATAAKCRANDYAA